jgi:hypothetical protein
LSVTPAVGPPPTMFSNTSSASTEEPPRRSTMYLFLGNTSVPKSLRRPAGKSRYMTGFWLSSWARVPWKGGGGRRQGQQAARKHFKAGQGAVLHRRLEQVESLLHDYSTQRRWA